MSRSNQNNLNLVGDGDDLDLIEATESAFGIKFADSELENVLTVGDLHQTILRHLSGAVRSPRQHCRSAAAFRRLRRAFKDATGADVHPSTKVATLMNRKREGYVMRDVQRRANLELDAIQLSSRVTRACIVAAVVAAAVWVLVLPPADSVIVNTLLASLTAFIGALAAPLIASAVTGDRFKRLDDRNITVGDLAARAAHLNFSRLTGRDEHNHPDDVRRTLLWLCRRMTWHNRLIDRETRIIG